MEVCPLKPNGSFTCFDTFSRQITDNQKMVIPANVKFTQLDLDQFAENGPGGKYCMKWWAAGNSLPVPRELVLIKFGTHVHLTVPVW